MTRYIFDVWFVYIPVFVNICRDYENLYYIECNIYIIILKIYLYASNTLNTVLYIFWYICYGQNPKHGQS